MFESGRGDHHNDNKEEHGSGGGGGEDVGEGNEAKTRAGSKDRKDFSSPFAAVPVLDIKRPEVKVKYAVTVWLGLGEWVDGLPLWPEQKLDDGKMSAAVQRMCETT